MQLKEFRFYEFNKNRSMGWWLYTVEGLDIEVNIQGNEYGVDQDWFDFAIDILQNYYKDIIDIAKNRLKCWGPPTNKDYNVESLYFGKYSYGPSQMFQSGFKLLLKTVGDSHEDIYGNFTINFNQNRWPIGYEFSIA